MSELIDFKTKKLIKKFKPIKKDKKQKTIVFLRELIKDLKEDRLDPEKCIVLLNWEASDDSD